MSRSDSVSKYRSKSYDIITYCTTDRIIDTISSASNASVNSFVTAALAEYLSLPDLLDTGRSARFDPTPASACVVCGNPLPEGKARYCSEECKKKARAAQAREARRKRLSQSQSPED